MWGQSIGDVAMSANIKHWTANLQWMVFFRIFFIPNEYKITASPIFAIKLKPIFQKLKKNKLYNFFFLLRLFLILGIIEMSSGATCERCFFKTQTILSTSLAMPWLCISIILILLCSCSHPCSETCTPKRQLSRLNSDVRFKCVHYTPSLRAC